MEWNDVAPYWDLLENFGFSPPLVDVVLPWVSSPVLVVGGGAGLVPEYLKKLDYQVTAIDASESMCHMAKIRRNVSIINASLLDYEPRDGNYSTVILSTGVLSSLSSPAERIDTFKRVRKLLKPDGRVIIATFGSDMSEELIDSYFRFDSRPSALECFIDAPDLSVGIEKIAESIHMDIRMARSLLAGSPDYLKFVFTLVKDLSVRLRADGVDPYQFIREKFVFKNIGFTAKQLTELKGEVAVAGFTLVTETWVDAANVYLAVAEE